MMVIHFTFCVWTVHYDSKWQLHYFLHYLHFNRAANWNLGEPQWTGRMRLVAKGVTVTLKLEDKVTGALYANCPVEAYPGNDTCTFSRLIARSFEVKYKKYLLTLFFSYVR